ncbi:MAG: site-specific DNA-methyltransferase [Deltaproteobacteria bacterium]|nr:site-specific DNA-methyltransferase [Deltaproteobacteria bacterium]
MLEKRGIKTDKYNGWKVGGIKPAFEPIVWAVKPPEGSYTDNILKWGVGGVNVDECRVEHSGDKLGGGSQKRNTFAGKDGWDRPWRHDEKAVKDACDRCNEQVEIAESKGRFPANVILDEEVGRLLDEQVPATSKGYARATNGKAKGNKGSLFKQGGINANRYDMGGLGASRFFYCAKASKSERNAGLEGMEEKVGGGMAGTADLTLKTGSGNIRNNMMKNNHPTVKPVALFKYLIKLVTHKWQTVLDPFMGSGTTGCACAEVEREFIGIEKEDEYIEIIWFSKI